MAYITVDIDATFSVFVLHNGIARAVATDECFFCQEKVDLLQASAFSLCRVGGDSRYGYEPLHNACDLAAPSSP